MRRPYPHRIVRPLGPDFSNEVACGATRLGVLAEQKLFEISPIVHIDLVGPARHSDHSPCDDCDGWMGNVLPLVVLWQNHIKARSSTYVRQWVQSNVINNLHMHMAAAIYRAIQMTCAT